MFPHPRLVWSVLVAALLGAAAALPSARQPPRAANVLVVTLDGMRWQEVFGGLAPDLLTKEAGGVSDAAVLERQYGALTPEARREKLMPFLWTMIATQGQIFGDASRGCEQRTYLTRAGDVSGLT